MTDPRKCHKPLCDNARLIGHGRYYCIEHECNVDRCRNAVDLDGRCRRHAYCRYPDCRNMRRQASAAKYCDDHATCINYEVTNAVPRTVTGSCLLCDAPVTLLRPRLGTSLFLCVNDRHLWDLVKRWRGTHHMTDEQIRRLLTDPHCWICGRDLSWRFTTFGKAGRTDRVTVDHDHQCCKGDGSCGACIRGLACDKHNRQLGVVEHWLADVGPRRCHELIDLLARPLPPNTV